MYMNYENVTAEKFTIAGIAVRTINKDGRSQQDIGELWNRFTSQNIFAQIPDKESNDIYCMYTDYESDFTGEYTTILGCKVTSCDRLPEGFVTKEIPKITYKHYKATGEIPFCVGKVWNDIWQSGVERKYIADFDVYGEKMTDPKNATVDIFVS